MGRRTDLHALLVAAVGSRNVYFQPPEGFKMAYPCIVYELERMESDHASNMPYLHRKRYSITVIDKDSESSIPDKIAAISTCHHDRHFVSDNLHHNVFTLYY